MSEEKKVKPMLSNDFVAFLENDIAKAVEKGTDVSNLALKVEVILTLDKDGKLFVESQEVSSGEIVKGE